jgi:hypothetical protein
MKKNERILGGQLWQQGGRSMTAVNGVIEDMPNIRESAIRTAAAEAVEWSHPIEPAISDGKRVSPRIVVYPADMPHIEESLSGFSQNPSEAEDGSHIAFAKILEHSAGYASPPSFLREDCSEIQNDPELVATVPLGLSIAAQVSVGSRDFVSETGPDVMNSSDEDSPQEERGDVLSGMYTSGLEAPVVLSQSEAARQRAAAEQLKQIGWGKWVNSDIPDSTSATSDCSQSVPSSPASTRCASRFDDPDTLKSQDIPRAKTPTGEVPSKPTVSTAVSMPPPKVVKRPQTFLGDSSGPSGDELPPPAVLLSSSSCGSISPPKKSARAAAKSSVAATEKGAGKKTSTRTADPEATHPMQTHASRAGRLRGVGGSGEKDTCVASGHPSQT